MNIERRSRRVRSWREALLADAERMDAASRKARALKNISGRPI